MRLLQARGGPLKRWRWGGSWCDPVPGSPLWSVCVWATSCPHQRTSWETRTQALQGLRPQIHPWTCSQNCRKDPQNLDPAGACRLWGSRSLCSLVWAAVVAPSCCRSSGSPSATWPWHLWSPTRWCVREGANCGQKCIDLKKKTVSNSSNHCYNYKVAFLFPSSGQLSLRPECLHMKQLDQHSCFMHSVLSTEWYRLAPGLCSKVPITSHTRAIQFHSNLLALSTTNHSQLRKN